MPEVEHVAGSTCRHLCDAGCELHSSPAQPAACRDYRCTWRLGMGASSDRPDRAGWLARLHDEEDRGEEDVAPMFLELGVRRLLVLRPVTYPSERPLEQATLGRAVRWAIENGLGLLVENGYRAWTCYGPRVRRPYRTDGGDPEPETLYEDYERWKLKRT